MSIQELVKHANAMRALDAAVVVFTSEELRGADVRRVEERLCELGHEVIDQLAGPDSDEEAAGEHDIETSSVPQPGAKSRITEAYQALVAVIRAEANLYSTDADFAHLLSTALQYANVKYMKVPSHEEAGWDASDMAECFADVAQEINGAAKEREADDGNALVDPTNADRASRVDKVLAGYGASDPARDELEAFSRIVDRLDSAADLLTDLRHWCDANHVDFAKMMKQAEMNYEAEEAEEAEIPPAPGM